MASAIDTKYAQLLQAHPWIGKPTIAEQVCPMVSDIFATMKGHLSTGVHKQAPI